MSNEYRLYTGFWRNHKTKRLQRELGDAGIVSLLKIWGYACDEKPDGILTGMDASAIEEQGDYLPDDGKLVDMLLKLGFLELHEGNYKIHDWEHHNPYVAARKQRSERNRLNAQKPRPSIVREAEVAAPTPEPEPIEMVQVEPVEKTPSIHRQVVDMFHELCPSFTPIRQITSGRRTIINQRCKDIGEFSAWADFFRKVQASKFLRGECDGGNTWKATFDWLLKQANFFKVLEGNYDDKGPRREFQPALTLAEKAEKYCPEPCQCDGEKHEFCPVCPWAAGDKKEKWQARCKELISFGNRQCKPNSGPFCAECSG